MEETRPKRNIVIIGGGVIGCTTAYFLTRHPKFSRDLDTITVLEASSIAAGASGKAGGLLALWAFPSCLVPLSFRLHAELAAEHNGAERWGYRAVSCGSIEAVVKAVERGLGEEPKAESQDDWAKIPKQDQDASSLLSSSPLPNDLDWIDPSVVKSYSAMGFGASSSTAQVHPFLFTTAISELASSAGAVIKTKALVTGITSSKTGVESVEYLDRATDAKITVSDVTDVVVAAGPWTGTLLPKSKIEGLRAHSVVYEADVSPHAVFTNIVLPQDYVPSHRSRIGQRKKHKGTVDPEIYARPNNEVYACGETDKMVPLPATADAVLLDEDQCDDLISYIATISPVLARSRVTAKQACYLPQHVRFSRASDPLVGKTTVPHLWIAAGHTCWGIQNGPATGKLMSEYIYDGAAKSANIDKLDPRKFKV